MFTSGLVYNPLLPPRKSSAITPGLSGFLLARFIPSSISVILLSADARATNLVSLDTVPRARSPGSLTTPIILISAAFVLSSNSLARIGALTGCLPLPAALAFLVAAELSMISCTKAAAFSLLENLTPWSSIDLGLPFTKGFPLSI